jgi:cold shock CspA family protein
MVATCVRLIMCGLLLIGHTQSYQVPIFSMAHSVRRSHHHRTVMQVSPTARPNSSKKSAESRVDGVCKWFDSGKGFGFVKYGDEDIFLPASEIASTSTDRFVAGTKVSFEIGKDKAGRQRATKVTLTGEKPEDGAKNLKEDMVSFKCFSMSQPFASLLMKGIKTIETRNSDIFGGYQGEVLLHVGRRPWPDKAYLQR